MLKYAQGKCWNMHQVLFKEMTTIKFHNKRTIAIPFGSHGGFSRGRLFTFQQHGSARYHWLTYVKYQIQTKKTSNHVICYTITTCQLLVYPFHLDGQRKKPRYGTRKKLWYNPQNFEGCTITLRVVPYYGVRSSLVQNYEILAVGFRIVLPTPYSTLVL